MELKEVTERLNAVWSQSYPLTLTAGDAEAMVSCIRRIMDEVPEDYRAMVCGDYALVTGALCHPDTGDGTNRNVTRTS